MIQPNPHHQSILASHVHIGTTNMCHHATRPHQTKELPDDDDDDAKDDGDNDPGDTDDDAEDPADEDDADAEQNPYGKSKPMKKSEFYKAYKSKGSHHMYSDIMHDPSLRSMAEMFVRVTRPLHRQYQGDLEAQQKGPTELLEWNAQRSLGAPFDTVGAILKAAVSPGLFQSMRLTPCCTPPLDPEFAEANLSEDFELVRKAFRFGVHLAGNCGWGEMLHRLTIPLAVNALLSQQENHKKRGMAHLKKMVEAIVKAENKEMVSNDNHLSRCLQDLAFTEEPFARELMILLRRADYDLADPNGVELMKAIRLFSDGSSSTKEVLESTFGHLTHVGNKSNNNKKMSPSNVWMYLTSSPFVKASGMSQSIPNAADWVRHISSYGFRTSKEFVNYTKAFKGNSTIMPKADDMQLPTNANGVLKSKWRLSGPASHYKSSAAMAFLMRDAEHDFRNCATAWAGTLLTNN